MTSATGSRTSRSTGPRRRTRSTPDAHELLKEIWADFRDDDALELAILTGTGDAFCAGADLKTYIPPRIGLGDAEIREVVDDGFGGLTRGCIASTSP